MKFLKKETDRHGYVRVKITFDGRKDNRLVSIHRLVANAFIPNPDHKPDVNHIDGNKSNNDVSNLEWCTKSENIQHAMRTGLKPPVYGEHHGMSKLTQERAETICKLLESGIYTIKDIMKITGETYDCVVKIIKRNTWVRVSQNYNIDNYHHKRQYDVKEYESVFKLMVTNKLSLYDISDETGVDGKTVFKIYTHSSTSKIINSLYSKYDINNYTLSDKEYTKSISTDMIKYSLLLKEKGIEFKYIERIISKKFDINEFYIHYFLKDAIKNYYK